MPKSAAPRKKSNPRSDRTLEVMQRAMALDRRRQAQINNQIASINRLLGEDHGYTEEMRVLHEGSAVLLASAEEARDALRSLVRAIDALHLDQLTVADRDTDTRPYLDALAQARALIDLSDPVTSQEAQVG